jgi:DNA-binding beta-propeller fold protein YncE
VVALAALGALELVVGAAGTGPVVQRGAPPAVAAPAFQVDPLWPKPLPNGWILGSITGLAVDSQDHIWIVHRGAASLTPRTENGLGTDPPTAELCCRPAPPVLEFDAAGNLVSSWGGPGQGYDWPQSPGGLAVDPKGNVWIAAAGLDPSSGRGGRGGRGRGGDAAAGAAPAPPAGDAHILKFSRKGQHLLTIGRAGQAGANDSTTAMNRPANLDFNAAGTEVFVADGFVNNRVIVFDAAKGAYRRHWQANGTPFRTVSCVSVARDGQVYVCDRQNNRLQVFRADGTFVKEATVAKDTLGNGAVWDVALSHDPQQRFVYVADGQNQRVRILLRESLQEIGSFGSGGRWPGHFYGVGSIGVDSRGNVYTGENLEGKRVQKFVLRPVTATPRDDR